MIEIDSFRTPAGPVTVSLEGGRVVGLHLGKSVPWKGRRARLPNARRWVAGWFAGKAPRVPLSVDASPFTRRVYEIVRRIPAGETLSYAQVARAAGRPGAARAVGNALARNRICLFIPCHRVVAASGLGGFSGEGGVTLKRRLLDLERSRRS